MIINWSTQCRYDKLRDYLIKYFHQIKEKSKQSYVKLRLKLWKISEKHYCQICKKDELFQTKIADII